MNWIYGQYVSVLIVKHTIGACMAEVWPETKSSGTYWSWVVSLDGEEYKSGVCDEYKQAEGRAESAIKQLMEDGK